MGSSARSLAVGDVCFKNTLYQSIKPPCTLLIIDMEPFAEAYIFLDKRQYAEAINDRLEPRGARDLIFQQFLERTPIQKMPHQQRAHHQRIRTRLTILQEKMHRLMK